MKIKGQGAIQNIHNHFEKNDYESSIYDYSEEETTRVRKYIEVFPKSIVNEIKSKDISFSYSMNPYQGCEHGCTYCYARPTHEYWGYSAGVDFERVIMIKKNAPELLEKFFNKKNYSPNVIFLSGNTDCYQPIERELRITRKVLEIFLTYKHPVSIITKNALLLRDLDVLTEMNKLNLVNVSISITTLNEKLRRILEPRTSSVKNKLSAIKQLSEAKIPVNIMVAPIIPSINSDEILTILKETSAVGASSFGYTLVRLNDSVAPVFESWLKEHFPERAEKVLNQIRSLHGGELGNKKTFNRITGNGNMSKMILDLFAIGKQKYFSQKPIKKSLSTEHFCLPPKKNEQLFLF